VHVYQDKMPESNKGSQRAQRKPWAGVPRVHAVAVPKNLAGAKKKRKA